MSGALDIVASVLMVLGALLTALAALGLLRLPDVYTRMHAASKAGALGAGLLLLGAGVASSDLAILVRTLLGIAFLLATTPVGAHLLARAALRQGTAPGESTSIIEYDRHQ